MFSASTGSYAIKPLVVGLTGGIVSAVYNPAYNTSDDLFNSEFLPAMAIPMAVGGSLAIATALNEFRKSMTGSTYGTSFNLLSEAVSYATVGAAEVGLFYIANSSSFEGLNLMVLAGEAILSYVIGSYAYDNIAVGTLVSPK